jgi:hypothetical protein
LLYDKKSNETICLTAVGSKGLNEGGMIVSILKKKTGEGVVWPFACLFVSNVADGF